MAEVDAARGEGRYADARSILLAAKAHGVPLFDYDFHLLPLIDREEAAQTVAQLLPAITPEGGCGLDRLERALMEAADFQKRGVRDELRKLARDPVRDCVKGLAATLAVPSDQSPGGWRAAVARVTQLMAHPGLAHLTSDDLPERGSDGWRADAMWQEVRSLVASAEAAAQLGDIDEVQAARLARFENSIAEGLSEVTAFVSMDTDARKVAFGPLEVNSTLDTYLGAHPTHQLRLDPSRDYRGLASVSEGAFFEHDIPGAVDVTRWVYVPSVFDRRPIWIVVQGRFRGTVVPMALGGPRIEQALKAAIEAKLATWRPTTTVACRPGEWYQETGDKAIAETCVHLWGDDSESAQMRIAFLVDSKAIDQPSSEPLVLRVELQLADRARLELTAMLDRLRARAADTRDSAVGVGSNDVASSAHPKRWSCQVRCRYYPALRDAFEITQTMITEAENPYGEFAAWRDCPVIDGELPGGGSGVMSCQPAS